MKCEECGCDFEPMETDVFLCLFCAAEYLDGEGAGEEETEEDSVNKPAT